MAKCIKCHERKGKRFCIALGGSVCSLCCGLLREKEIHCPSHCTFLVQHKPYQEKKIIGKKKPTAKDLVEDDILRDERMAWLAFQAEIPIKSFSDRKGTITDRDVLLALEYTKQKLEKETGTIILPDERLSPLNELGEIVYRRIEDCRYEKKVILPGEHATYSKEEKIKCLDRLILAVRHWSQGDLDGRIYLDKLEERFSHLQKISNQKKIITRSKA